MENRDLMYFETIAELGHVGKAAEKLFLTQPALTRAIRRLEEHLGAPLFERQGRGLKLTPLGLLLQEKAEKLRHIYTDTERELLNFAQGRSGCIRLGCAPTVATWLLAGPIAELRKQAPDIRLDLTFDMGKRLLESFYAHQLDMVISYIDSQLREEYHAIPLFSDAVVVAASATHPIFSSPYSADDLVRYKWIFPKQSMFTRIWLEKTMDKLGLPPPEVYIETNTMLYIFNLAASSQSLCFLSRRNLSLWGEGTALREVEIAELTLHRTFSMVQHKEVQSQALTRFSRIMQEYASLKF